MTRSTQNTEIIRIRERPKPNASQLAGSLLMKTVKDERKCKHVAFPSKTAISSTHQGASCFAGFKAGVFVFGADFEARTFFFVRFFCE